MCLEVNNTHVLIQGPNELVGPICNHQTCPSILMPLFYILYDVVGYTGAAPETKPWRCAKTFSKKDEGAKLFNEYCCSLLEVVME